MVYIFYRKQVVVGYRFIQANFDGVGGVWQCFECIFIGMVVVKGYDEVLFVFFQLVDCGFVFVDICVFDFYNFVVFKYLQIVVSCEVQEDVMKFVYLFFIQLGVNMVVVLGNGKVFFFNKGVWCVFYYIFQYLLDFGFLVNSQARVVLLFFIMFYLYVMFGSYVKFQVAQLVFQGSLVFVVIDDQFGVWVVGKCFEQVDDFFFRYYSLWVFMEWYECIIIIKDDQLVFCIVVVFDNFFF